MFEAPRMIEASSIDLSIWRNWLEPASMPTCRFFTTMAATTMKAVPVRSSGAALKVLT
ncbi:hypothetical protein D3C72_2388730 [compost metagenome]